MFCPGCSKLLTGLHMSSKCYTNWIEKKSQQILKKNRRKVMTGGSEEPIIIGLVIAVVIGIGIVCFMDALRNKLK